MSYVGRLYELYELCKLYEYFMNHLKSLEITWNHLNCFKCNFFFFLILNFFCKRKITGGFKDKVVSLFNTKAPKQTVYEKGKKLSKPKTQN